MQRFLDPDLFPNDLIADYFQSISPTGLSILYQLFAAIGLNPLFVNKLLPTVLGLITTAYCFGVGVQILPVPAAGFLSSLLLNQCLWMSDDLASGTARSFFYPVFMAFLYYLLRRSLFPCLIALALQVLFYPPVALISAGVLILGLWDWQSLPLHFIKNRQYYWFVILGLGVILVGLLPEVVTGSRFGSVITGEQAKSLPEFFQGGRTKFFSNNLWSFWFAGSRSGIRLSLTQPLMAVGFLLPILHRFPRYFPLVKQLKNATNLFPQIVLVSLGLFFAAHAVLFKLYLPSRYTVHTFRIVMAVAAGITFIIIFDALLVWGAKTKQTSSIEKMPIFLLNSKKRQSLSLSLICLLLTALIFYPLVWNKYFPKTNYIVGNVPTLYNFFAKQPKNIMIASLTGEANNLPSFSGRSILVGQEYAIPFHVGYYFEFRQRVQDLIRAQYSQELAVLKEFIEKYEIDFWILENHSFQPDYVANNRWFKQFQPVAGVAVSTLEQGSTPALAKVVQQCSVFEVQGLTVLQANCILNQENK